MEVRVEVRVKVRVEVRVGSDAVASSPAACIYIYITCGRMLPPRLRRPATSLPRSQPS